MANICFVFDTAIKTFQYRILYQRNPAMNRFLMAMAIKVSKRITPTAFGDSDNAIYRDRLARNCCAGGVEVRADA
jgi:hypothetical protein